MNSPVNPNAAACQGADHGEAAILRRMHIGGMFPAGGISASGDESFLLSDFLAIEALVGETPEWRRKQNASIQPPPPPQSSV